MSLAGKYTGTEILASPLMYSREPGWIKASTQYPSSQRASQGHPGTPQLGPESRGICTAIQMYTALGSGVSTWPMWLIAAAVRFQEDVI